MKEALFLAVLAVALYFHFRNAPAPAQAVAEQAAPAPAHSNTFVVTPSSTYNRWKSGPNAQTQFEPFTPNEQATWNQGNPGSTITAGISSRPTGR